MFLGFLRPIGDGAEGVFGIAENFRDEVVAAGHTIMAAGLFADLNPPLLAAKKRPEY